MMLSRTDSGNVGSERNHRRDALFGNDEKAVGCTSV